MKIVAASNRREGIAARVLDALGCTLIRRTPRKAKKPYLIIDRVSGQVLTKPLHIETVEAWYEEEQKRRCASDIPIRSSPWTPISRHKRVAFRRELDAAD
jgi:hypothetical protein